MNKPCVFCSTADVQTREIIGDAYAWAFPTNIPIVPGHVLIAPRRCVARYEDLTIKEKTSVEELRIKMMDALRRAFGAEGFNFAWNDGIHAGQSVFHFHLHVVPRRKGDEGVHEYEPRQFLYRPGERMTSPESELLHVSQLIKQCL